MKPECPGYSGAVQGMLEAMEQLGEDNVYGLKAVMWDPPYNNHRIWISQIQSQIGLVCKI